MDNITIDLSILPKIKPQLAMPCLVCGEGIVLTEEEEAGMYYGHHVHSKICDKCRAAILYMREQMEHKEN